MDPNRTETVLKHLEIILYGNSEYIIGLFEGLSTLYYVKYFENFQVYNKHNHYVNVGHYYLLLLKNSVLVGMVAQIFK